MKKTPKLTLPCSHTRADTLKAHEGWDARSAVRIEAQRKHPHEYVPIILSRRSAERLRDFLTTALRSLPTRGAKR